MSNCHDNWRAHMVSDALSTTLFRQPPPILYHYTTQRGLLGIIKDKEIWATHTQYLNDTSEFRLTRKLMKSAIEERMRNAVGNHLSILSGMRDCCSFEMERNDVCVCSFSEEEDSLSQWRAYGDPTSSYAIGFSSDHLGDVTCLSDPDHFGKFLLTPCVYKEQDHQTFVKMLVNIVHEENQKSLARGEEPGPIPGGTLSAFLCRYAPILKHISYKEENEWRIITPVLGGDGPKCDYRCGKSTLIPYYRFPLDKADSSRGIKEIVIGPTPQIEESEVAVKGFLESQGWELSVVTKRSKIPFRNW